MKRKFTFFLLTVMLTFNLSPITAKAANHTQAEAIAWVQSLVGQSLDKDGVYGAQCVDLALAYYDYMGVPRSSGNGKDYATNALPSGWQRIQGAAPQPGDILVYSANSENPYGHVAIYESDYVTYHQNFAGNQWVRKITNIRYDSLSNPYWGIIRPDFNPVSVSISWELLESTPSDTDFYTKVIATSNISGTWTEAGITIWDKNLNIVGQKSEYPTYQRNDMNIFYNITDELNITLTKGTAYTYQYHVKFDNQYYYSPVYTITTTGEAPIIPFNRLSGSDRSATALSAAAELRDCLNKTNYDAMILASGNNFADALAGSYLAGKKNAPILLHTETAVLNNEKYILDNLSNTGTVYILGGTAAVPEAVENRLKEKSVNVIRLKGKDRYLTNLEILNEAGITPGQEIIVCTGQNFADSLSASATGLPILLVNNTTETLTYEQKVCLFMWKPEKITIIGGTGAVNKELEQELSSFCETNRIYGTNRYETSKNIAEHYFKTPSKLFIAYGENFPDGLCGGPLAFANNAPLILTAPNRESVAATYVDQNSTITSAYVLGGTGVLSETTVINILK